MVFVLKNPSFEANLVLSTLNPDIDSQSDISELTKPNAKRKAVPKRAPKKSIKTATRPAPNSTVKSIKNINSRTPEIRIDASQNRSQKEYDKISSNTSVNNCSIQELHLDENHMRYTPNIRLSSIDSGLNTPESSNAAAKSRIVKNVFSSLTKRKSNPGESSERNEEDLIPCSPPRQPSKKARLIFQKCFKSTFDPRMLPGHDQVLAEDSDEETK